jgi:hypothetical protein
MVNQGSLIFVIAVYQWGLGMDEGKEHQATKIAATMSGGKATKKEKKI